MVDFGSRFSRAFTQIDILCSQARLGVSNLKTKGRLPLHHPPQKSIASNPSQLSVDSTFVDSLQSRRVATKKNEFALFFILRKYSESVLAPVFRSGFELIVRLSRWRDGVSRLNPSCTGVHRITIIESSGAAPLGPAVAQILGWKYVDARLAEGAPNSTLNTKTVVSCDQPTSPDHEPHGLTVVVADVCDLKSSNEAEPSQNFSSDSLNSQTLRNSENLRKVMMALRPASSRPGAQRRTRSAYAPQRISNARPRFFGTSHEPPFSFSRRADAEDEECDRN